MHMLVTLHLTFLRICLLRTTPQDLPYQIFFFKLIGGYYFVIQMVWGALQGVKISAVPFFALVSLLLIAFIVWLLLLVVNHRQRFVQTMIALLGVYSLIDLSRSILLIWLQYADENTLSKAIPALLFIIATLWTWVVQGHVLRHALSIDFIAALIVSILIYIMNFSTLSSLFF